MNHTSERAGQSTREGAAKRYKTESALWEITEFSSVGKQGEDTKRVSPLILLDRAEAQIKT